VLDLNHDWMLKQMAGKRARRSTTPAKRSVGDGRS
jgi:hypothetical protein